MLGEHYPEADAHLRRATAAHRRMAELWAEMLECPIADEHVVTAPNGSGRIFVGQCWPDGAREALTEAFRECVDELWAVFDSLVAETVGRLSVLQRANEPERPRFFPLADTEDGFIALLEESCLDGILKSQQRLISSCQPFNEPPPIPAAQQVRGGLALLLDWSCRLDDGALVGAWVTPVEPSIEVDEPHEVTRLDVAEAGPLTDETVVATYQLSGGNSGSVRGQPGSYLDLAFADGFEPTDANDTLDRRVKAAIDATIVFAAAFTNCMSSVGPVGRVSGEPQEPGDLWTSIADSPADWSDDVLETLRASELGIGLLQGDEDLIFLVTTEDGVFERRIPRASPLNPNVTPGTAAEMATHNAAATWGLPDFVLLPEREHAGNRNREISDGLIVAGDRGAVVQVKKRESAPGDEPREAAWTAKNVAKAASQIHGTVRRLNTGPVDMTNGRNRSVRVDGAAVMWVGVVIVDHPDPPNGLALDDHRKGSTGVVTLLRRDWEFLFNQLRSTRQVLDYLHRVGEPCSTLGEEPARYFELAVADHEAEPGPVDPTLEGEQKSVPLLPMAPAGHLDARAHGLFRMMLEDIANSPTEDEEHERISVLAAMDRLPVGHRTELGQLLLCELNATDPEEGLIRWRFRRYVFTLDVPQLGFGVCSEFSETTREAFRTWVLLRHHDRGTPEELEQASTVGVLLTPRSDGLRDWDTTLLAVRGRTNLNDDEVAEYRRLWDQSNDTDLSRLRE